MKKITLLVLLFASTFAIAQEVEEEQEINATQENFNEIKLNAVYLIAGAFDILYERTINEESAFGISLMASFDDDGIGNQYKYMVTPYYRFYFGKKYAAGFFAEGFGSLNSSREVYLFGNSNSEFKTDFAVGFGIGGKWITKRGIIFEIPYGYGRNLFTNSDNDSNINNLGAEFIVRSGINIGYRF